MVSLEKKSEPCFDAVMSSSFPTIYVDDEQMPELANWEVDGEYTLTVKIRVKSKNQVATLDGLDTDACIELLEYEVQKD